MTEPKYDPYGPYADQPTQLNPVVFEPKQRHRYTWLYALIVVAVVLGLGIAAIIAGSSGDKKIATTPKATTAPVTGMIDPTTPPPSPDGPDLQGMKLGTQIHETGTNFDDTEFAQTITALSVKTRTTGCGAYADGPTKGNKYLIAAVSYAVTKGAGNYNPLDWSVTDFDGNGYESSDAIFSNCTTLTSSNSSHGKHKGNVTFEIPASLKHGLIILDDGGDSVSWKF